MHEINRNGVFDVIMLLYGPGRRRRRRLQWLLHSRVEYYLVG